MKQIQASDILVSTYIGTTLTGTTCIGVTTTGTTCTGLTGTTPWGVAEF